MTRRLSGHLFIFGLASFVLKTLLGIARQWSLKKIAILSLKPRTHARILIYQTWANPPMHKIEPQHIHCINVIRSASVSGSGPLVGCITNRISPKEPAYQQSLSFICSILAYSIKTLHEPSIEC